MNQRYLRILPFLLLFLFLYACEKERDERAPDPVYLVESELLDAFTAEELKSIIDDSGELPAELSLLIRYDISVYRIEYLTVDTYDEPVLASGALVVPDNITHMPLISFQHGTITSEADAPSYFSANIYLTTVLYASAGYIIALPDYLGYGSSQHLDHPYEHGHSLATASRDMLRSVREFDMENDDFTLNEKLFLTGYSQGGYATMALLKLLEEEHADEFTVTAATAGAGAYNKSMFARHILESNVDLTYINYFLWVLDTYNRVYGLNRPYDYFFDTPYAEIIEQDGIFANNEKNPMKLFNSGFRSAVLRGDDPAFISAIADNDNYDWKPATPLELYHGTDDDFVFYFNSATAYEAMTSRGADSVELITIQGGDHATTVSDYFTGTFLFFNSFK
ncbi:MAG: alpha/beta fold hydrolase [Bacteroidales bacterium]